MRRDLVRLDSGGKSRARDGSRATASQAPLRPCPLLQAAGGRQRALGTAAQGRAEAPCSSVIGLHACTTSVNGQNPSFQTLYSNDLICIVQTCLCGLEWRPSESGKMDFFKFVLHLLRDLIARGFFF